MFSSLFAAVLMMAGPSAEPSLPLELAGRCDYPERAREFTPSTVLAFCDGVTISGAGSGPDANAAAKTGVESDGSRRVFDFTQGSRESILRFYGTKDGERFVIDRVRLRSGRIVAAKGVCSIFYAETRISIVACLANGRARNYAANFIPRRYPD